AGHCVLIQAGQTTSLRTGDNSGPLPPSQAALSTLTTAVEETNVGGGAGAIQTAAEGGAPIGKGLAINLGGVAGRCGRGGSVGVGVRMVSKGSISTTPVPPRGQCPPQSPACG